MQEENAPWAHLFLNGDCGWLDLVGWVVFGFGVSFG
jgi:hypothetical protein